MSIARVASSTNEAASGTAATPTEPTGTAENDYVFCMASVATTPSDGTWTAPGDFTEITQKVETLGNLDGNIYLGYKKRAATAGSGYTFTYGGTAGSIKASLLSLRGCDLTNFLDVAYSEGSHYTSGTNNPNGTCQPIDTVTNGAWVLAIEQCSQTITGPTGPPTGWTAQIDFMTGADRLHYVASINDAVFGTVTPGAFNHTDSVGTADARLFTLAIRPAVASTSKLAVLKRNRHF